ncbi:MAG: CRTAC1 family protein, partial [Verrucomicrobiota bacterium]
MTNPIAAQVLPLLKPFEVNRTLLAWRALGTVWLIFLGCCLVVFLHAGLAAADLEWTNGAGFRSAPITPRAPGKNGFTKLEITTTGIHFTNQLGDDRSIFNRNLLSGSGVAAGDIDGDGRCDLYFCGLDNRNALFRNLGDWKFEDVTAASGVACDNEDATAAALADIDGDGDLDLLVNCLSNGTRIFQNDGKGKFTEITDAAGVRSKTGSMSMTLADIDGDSDLDLYIVNYRPVTIMDAPSTQFRIQMVGNRALVALVNGRPATLPEYTNRFVVTPSGNVLELGQPDVLYRNDGRGRFTPVSFTGGAFRDEDGNVLREPPRDWGLAAQFHDMNGDGAPDLYVCNDLFSPDRVWMNDGKGNFRALPPLALRSTSTFSMGVDFADVDRDDDVDFFVVDMLSREHQKRHVQVGESSPVFFPPGLIDNQPQYLRNTLQVNRGDTTFAETSFFSGLEASEWSWGPIFLDVDLDGFEDILVTNGQHRDFQNVDLANRMEATRAAKGLTEEDRVRFVKMFPSLESPNLIFRNRGDLTFEEVGAAWGFATPGISQGAALADLDNDGDLDVVMNNLNSAAGIYRNDTAAPRVAIRLKGRAPNTQGVGANIRVTGGPVAQAQEMICAGRYLSADDAMRVFAAGTNSKPLTIEVRWRSGRVSHITNAVANRIYEIAEPELQETTPPIEGKKAPSPVFVDVSHLLNHLHHEEPFDDFERQPLLPNRLSQLGPGVCWHDLDGDGWDDLFIGSGRGGKLAIFRNNTQGGFQPMDSPANRTVTRDQTALLGYSSLLLAGSSNFEDGLTNGAAVKLFAFLQNKADDSFPGRLSSTGPLALADIDGDDDLDLFVGGRMIPGRYPEPATSWIMRNDAGKFALVQSLENVGLVSGAVFSDLNGDGRPD